MRWALLGVLVACTPSCAAVQEFFSSSRGEGAPELVTGVVADLLTGNWPGAALKLTGLAALLLGGGKVTQMAVRHRRAMKAANQVAPASDG